jgi:tRNA 2-thiouridine synthesizing protein A
MLAKKLDVTGRACPIPIVELMRAMAPLESGQEIEIRADDRAFPADVKAWCSKTGHALVEITQSGETFTARVKKKPAK